MGHKKVSSKRLATKASAVLRNRSTSRTIKSLGGSVMSQARGKHKK